VVDVFEAGHHDGTLMAWTLCHAHEARPRSTASIHTARSTLSTATIGTTPATTKNGSNDYRRLGAQRTGRAVRGMAIEIWASP
jgi:hypothetical protein